MFNKMKHMHFTMFICCKRLSGNQIAFNSLQNHHSQYRLYRMWVRTSPKSIHTSCKSWKTIVVKMHIFRKVGYLHKNVNGNSHVNSSEGWLISKCSWRSLNRTRCGQTFTVRCTHLSPKIPIWTWICSCTILKRKQTFLNGLYPCVRLNLINIMHLLSMNKKFWKNKSFIYA